MPRVSKQLYLDRHRFLAKAWTDFQRLYSVVPVSEQWAVHAYYLPTEDLSDKQLLEHRARVTRERPSLPHQAGQTFNQLYRAFRTAYEYANGDEQRFHTMLLRLTDRRALTTSTNRKRTLHTTTVARSEPDLELFAQAIVEMARQQQSQPTKR